MEEQSRLSKGSLDVGESRGGSFRPLKSAGAGFLGRTS